MAYGNQNNNNNQNTVALSQAQGQAQVDQVNTTVVQNNEIQEDQLTTSVDSVVVQDIKSKIIDKTFGRKGDYIELHVYNATGQKILSEDNFTEYTIPPDQDCYPLTRELNLQPNEILSSRGFLSGVFTLSFHPLKNKIFDTTELPFIIQEISTDRREIKAIASLATNAVLDPAVGSFISELETSSYFKEFSINLGNGVIIPCINILLNKGPVKHEILFKTLSPLPATVTEKLSFKVVEEIIDPIRIDVDLGDPVLLDDTIELQSPNFSIDIKQNMSVPSELKSYDSILTYHVTSSYQHLLSKLEKNSANININYDYIRPIPSNSIEDVYHFENFTHFSSATERLKNFEYKLKLIETYDSQLDDLNNIPEATSASQETKKQITDINGKKTNLIKGFDGYEQFLYFESRSYAWPKQNTEKPYILYSRTSSEAKTWLGTEESSFPHYGGQLLSASLFDRQNEYNLNKLIPTHIVENDNNSLYVSFVNMVGQHFDTIWTYIKALSDIYDGDNQKGISKDLVYYQLKSFGIEAFDQFENTSLTEYMLGIGSGSNTYNVGFTYGPGHYLYSGSTTPSETLITASNNSISKDDITKEVWKRLYHNASYLLKTKGTERGIRALMSCYGIPSTILNIKEYGGSTSVTGGPLKDLKTADFYKTFSYEKSGLALKGDSGTTTGHFIKTDWSSSLTDALSASAKTVEFRIKPLRSDNTYHLFGLSGSNAAKDPHLVLTPYTGNDISSSGDSTQYGKLDLYINNTIVESTANFPIYNGDFWNIHIGTLGTSGSSAEIQFGAYQANFNKNISKYVTSSTQTEADRQLTFGDPFNGGNNIGGALHAYFGGVPSNGASAYNTVDTLRYSGSLQEIRYHFGELLSDTTLQKHALEPFMYSGNSLSSSFNNVVLRLPLGSNDIQDSSSFHPNIDIDYLGGGSNNLTTQEWEEIVETHHLPTPDTVGISTTSEKVRIDKGTVDENILDPFIKSETSTLDRQPPEYEDLGIFFSPTNEINEDILYTLGSFRLDDYIGSPLPSAQTSSKYEDLKDIKDIYFQKVKRRYNYWDYVKTIQHMDHTLFKIIEQWVPFRSNLKTGLVIEPHFLERTKFKRTLPVRSDGQTMVEGTHQNIEVQLNSAYGEGTKLYTVASSSAGAFGQDIGNVKGQWDPGSYVTHHNNFDRNKFITGSKGRRTEQGTNTTIFVYDDYLDPFLRDKNAENNQAAQAPIKPFTGTKSEFPDYIAHESSVLLGNATQGRKSNKYYVYKQYNLNNPTS
tara:strand:- start:6851 stop:10621 length:3771 start_codon:yes stop_codon:yes gene_type:complete